MAWIFLSGGLLLPSLAPMDKADPALTLGYRELQVRGRLTEHLQYFIDTYMDPHGLDHSDIEETPFTDYNCRFYATREAFAQAMGYAMLDIDYRKFKQTAEDKDETGKFKYAHAKVYHSVLDSIWAISTRLNQPGGWYGPWSPSNPKGFTPRRGRSIGSTFHGTAVLDDEYWSTPPLAMDDDLDYTPTREQEAEDLLDELRGIPVDDWRDELSDREYELVKPYMKKARREQRVMNRKFTRSLRRSKGKRSYS